MTEHEQELRDLFNKGSFDPGMEDNPNEARLMTFEGFKLIADILMNKAEYFGKMFSPLFDPPYRA